MTNEADRLAEALTMIADMPAHHLGETRNEYHMRKIAKEAIAAWNHRALSTPTPLPSCPVCGKGPSDKDDARGWCTGCSEMGEEEPDQGVVTEAAMDENLEATQADRDAAADVLFHVYGDPFVDNIRDGWEDESYIVQAFARHRQQSVAAALSARPEEPAQGAAQRAKGALDALGWRFELRDGMSLKIEDSGGVGTGTSDEAVMYDALEDIAALTNAATPADNGEDDR